MYLATHERPSSNRSRNRRSASAHQAHRRLPTGVHGDWVRAASPPSFLRPHRLPNGLPLTLDSDIRKPQPQTLIFFLLAAYAPPERWMTPIRLRTTCGRIRWYDTGRTLSYNTLRPQNLVGVRNRSAISSPAASVSIPASIPMEFLAELCAYHPPVQL